jgi:hypothetical protein
MRIWVAISAVLSLVGCVGADGDEDQDQAGDVSSENASAVSASFANGVSLGNVQDPVRNEISGCAASRTHQNAFWMNNDSGDSAEIFAFGRNGGFLGKYSLSGSGVSAIDYEDIAVGPGPVSGKNYIYVGDIGDNSANRQTKHIYRAAEPSSIAASGSLPVDNIQIVYPDGPEDAETLMVDPANGDVYVVSKRLQKNNVYLFKAPMVSGKTYTGTIVATIPIYFLTGGDISRDGTRILMRTTTKNYMWTRASGETIAKALSRTAVSVPAVQENQGEAICWDASSKSYYTTSEGNKQPFHFFQGM